MWTHTLTFFPRSYIRYTCTKEANANTQNTRAQNVNILSGGMKSDLQLNNSSQQITRGSSRKGKKTEHMLVDSWIGYKEMLSYHECSWQIKKKNIISKGAIHGEKMRDEVCVESEQMVPGQSGLRRGEFTSLHSLSTCISVEHSAIKVINITSRALQFSCLYSQPSD